MLQNFIFNKFGRAYFVLYGISFAFGDSFDGTTFTKFTSQKTGQLPFLKGSCFDPIGFFPVILTRPLLLNIRASIIACIIALN